MAENFKYTPQDFKSDQEVRWCPGCGEMIIQRDGYSIGVYRLTGNRCQACETMIAGHFDNSPGNWGSRRLPVQIQKYSE